MEFLLRWETGVFTILSEIRETKESEEFRGDKTLEII